MKTTTTTDFPYSFHGLAFNVVKTNGMIDMNGRALYELRVKIEGIIETDNFRASNMDFAIYEAQKILKNNFSDYFSN